MSDIIVEVQQGRIKGTTGQDYYGGDFYKFLGIPYAKAPVGELRFKAPQPPEPWSGIKDCTREGAECPSNDIVFLYCVGNEDNCLNLNIYTKELPQSDDKPLKKPVMFWVHGGAFTSGSNKAAMYGPDFLLTQDIVLVVINYRLGILGFASFKDQSLDVPGNAGLKDMRMALKWVQKNIDKFGGDPNNVTIFGESAGAASVHYLTLAPTTKGLFHKAIVQSGCALNNWAWGTSNALRIAKFLDYKETDEKEILEKLMKEPAKNLVNAQKRHKEYFSTAQIRPFGPVVEPPSPEAIITENPNKTMYTQGGHKIPMIIGYNSNEGILFELMRRSGFISALPCDFEQEIPYELGLERGSEVSKEISNRIRKEYFNGNKNQLNEDDIDKVYKLKGDNNFVHPLHRTLKLQAKHSDQPVYAYRMSLRTSLNCFFGFLLNKYFYAAVLCNMLGKLAYSYLPSARKYIIGLLQKLPKKEVEGVAHADDIFYLFTTYFTPHITPGSEEDKHIQKFVKMWTNFARHGQPTPEADANLNNAKWQPTSHDNLEFLDIGSELKMIGNVDGDRLKIWDDIYEKHLKF